MKEWLLVLSVVLWSAPSLATEVAGVEIPDAAELGDGAPALVLNGAGVRRKFFFKIYVGALYLSERAGTLSDVLAQMGPRRVMMHFVYGEVTREQLVEGWNEGFENNHTDAEMTLLRPRLERFNALFETVKEGDRILIDYLPASGTRVTIRNDVKGVVPGKDFNDALLRVWLGRKPASRGLKRAMLGGD